MLEHYRNHIHPKIEDAIKYVEPLGKLINYIGGLLVFIFCAAAVIVGVDYRSVAGIQEKTGDQKKIISEINLKGYETSASGALSALKKGDPIIKSFLLAEIDPGAPQSRESLLTAIKENRNFGGSIADIAKIFKRDEAVVSLVKAISVDLKSINDRISKISSIKNISEFCKDIAPMQSGVKVLFPIENYDSCIASFRDGTIVIKYIEIYNYYKNWSPLLDNLEFLKLDSDAAIQLALLLEKGGEGRARKIDMFNREVISSTDDMQVRRFYFGAQGGSSEYEIMDLKKMNVSAYIQLTPNGYSPQTIDGTLNLNYLPIDERREIYKIDMSKNYKWQIIDAIFIRIDGELCAVHLNDARAISQEEAESISSIIDEAGRLR